MSMIKRDFKTLMIFTLKLIGVWITAFLVLMIFRHIGTLDSQYYQAKEPFNLGTEIRASIFIGTITGIFYTILELFFDRPFFQKISFGKLILLKNVLYFLTAKIIFLLAVLFYSRIINLKLETETLVYIMRSGSFWVILLYFMLVSILISFVLQVSQKFGPGMLWSFLIGKYHTPHQEERIFLFIDMRSSTTIAEELGHIKFSQLLQDCFFDLTEVITKHQVDIYQYVGDEAVLSWVKEKGVIDQRCLHAYYDFMKILKDRKDHYIQKYGLEPFFKAGLHMGTVTVAEVGVIKKEIAYHGDVLNTAARIQGECNKFGQSLLVSEEVIKQTSLGAFFSTELMEAPLLRGKKEAVQIYGVKRV